MRSISKARSIRNAAARPVREQLRAETDRCDWCGKCGPLDIHEILRGPMRVQALDQRCCLLVLGRPCHDALHRMAGDDARLCGLAILYHVRSADYCLSEINRLLNPRAPNAITQREVDVWIARLTKGAI